MSAKNLTVKELSARMDILTENFQRDLEQFKEEIKHSSESSAVGTSKDELLRKFTLFEEKVNNDIKVLKEELNEVNKSSQNILHEMDNYQQSDNNKKILIHGVEEINKNEDVYSTVIDLLKNKVGVELTKSEINNCYRLGLRSDKKKRPIVLEFINQWRRDEVFAKKSALKGTKILISEMLTKIRYKLFLACFKSFGKNCWTHYGTTFVMVAGRKEKIYSEEQINTLLTGK